MTPVPKNVGGQVLPAGAQPLRPDDPTAIGGHRLAGRLTAGRTRVVYLARDGQGGLVAVKTSRTDDGHAEVRRRLRREAACLHRLPGTCAVRLLVDGSRQAPPYLVSEYVEGPTLRDLVEEHGPLGGVPVRALASALAHALAVVHAARIAHCDVRPGNVLLAPDGPRLMDFGVAEETGAPGDQDVSVTDDPLRDPPLGSGPARDVFGWGCLVAYAATGNRRFADADLDAPAALGLARELDDVAEPLRGLVEAALADDPAARPTARDLAARLDGGDRDSRRLPAPPGARTARPVPPGARTARPVPPGDPATGSLAAAGAIERPAGPPRRPVGGPVPGPSAGAPAGPPRGPATTPRAAAGGVSGPGHDGPGAAAVEPRRERPALAPRAVDGVPGHEGPGAAAVEPRRERPVPAPRAVDGAPGGHDRPAAASPDHERPASLFDPGPGPEPGTGGFVTREGHGASPAATSFDAAGRTGPEPGSSGVPGNGREHVVGASFRPPAGTGPDPVAAPADGEPTEAFELPPGMFFDPAAGSGPGADAFTVRRAEGTAGPAGAPSGPNGGPHPRRAQGPGGGPAGPDGGPLPGRVHGPGGEPAGPQGDPYPRRGPERDGRPSGPGGGAEPRRTASGAAATEAFPGPGATAADRAAGARTTGAFAEPGPRSSGGPAARRSDDRAAGRPGDPAGMTRRDAGTGPAEDTMADHAAPPGSRPGTRPRSGPGAAVPGRPVPPTPGHGAPAVPGHGVPAAGLSAATAPGHGAPAAQGYGVAGAAGLGAATTPGRGVPAVPGPGASAFSGHGVHPASGAGVTAVFGHGAPPTESMAYDDPGADFAGEPGETGQHGTGRRPRRGRALVVLSGLALLTGACAAVVATTGTGAPARPTGPADPGAGAVQPSPARGTHRPAVLRGRGTKSGTPDPGAAAGESGAPHASSVNGTGSRRHRSGGSTPGTASSRPSGPTKKPSPSPTPSKTPTPSPTPTPSSPGA